MDSGREQGGGGEGRARAWRVSRLGVIRRGCELARRTEDPGPRSSDRAGFVPLQAGGALGAATEVGGEEEE